MEINWIGPLFPDRTDIAGFTARLLPSLARKADINLVSENPKPAKLPKALSGVRVFSLDRLHWKTLNHADFSVFNIGNNYDFHARTYECIEKHSGTVILHDHCLHQFFDAWIWHHTPEPLITHRDWVLQCHGPEAAEMVDLIHCDQTSLFSLAESQPLNDPVLRRAKSVICHSPVVEEDASIRFGLPTRLLNLPYPAPYTREVIKQRKDLRRNRNTLELMAFGYLGNDSRCVSHVIEAISRIPERHRIRLTLAGWIQPGYLRLLKDLVRHHRLESCVRIAGFMSDRRLDHLIMDADLILNLRKPTLGEASGSLLRAWSCATATVVSDAGWYAGLPDRTCIKIPPGHETDHLEALLAGFLTDSEMLSSIGWDGFEHLLTHHNCESYVDGLVEHLQTYGRSLQPLHNLFARRIGRIAAEHSSGNSNMDTRWINHMENNLDSFLDLPSMRPQERTVSNPSTSHRVPLDPISHI